MRLGLIGGDVDKSSVSGIFTPEERVSYEKTAGNIQNYIYNSKSKLVSAQDTAPQDVFFSLDGTIAYIMGTTNNTIFQYTLSTPWDISTATYASKSKLLDAPFGESAVQAIFITPDGINLYLLGSSVDRVYYYRLTTPWDITTAIRVNIYDAVTQVAAGTATGVKFGDSGTKMYIVSTSTQEVVYQYTLSTAYDILTASYASKSLTITTQDGLMTDIAFSSDGTKLYASGDTNNTVYQYTLSTPWDISTGSYATKSLAVGTQDITPRAFVFNDDGTKGYLVGDTNNTIYQYTFSVAWDISTGTYASKSFSVGGQAASPQSICFKSDGTIFYIVEDGSGTANAIFQYTLGTPWDISTATYASKSVTTAYQNYSYEFTPSGLDISSDGTKIYFVGQNNGLTTQSKVYSYELTTPWDISTANTYLSPTLTAQSTTLNGLYFKPDGTKAYVLGASALYQYSLTPAWNLTSLTYDSVSLTLSGQDSSPQGFAFNRNGTKLIVNGATNDKIYQYNLTTPWSISTASFVRSIDISQQEGTSRGVVFSNDGNKIYMVGDTTDTIYQYDLAFG
jgi:6-phosphogluconolactonase (cycloisomerase 2 family)